MCGRFVQVPFSRDCPWPELAVDAAKIDARYNVSPTQRVAVVMREGVLEVRKLRWGLIPSWVKDLSGGYSTINARLETVATKPAYRAAWKAPRRCLIPLAGYYEWREEGGKKQPYYIARKDGKMLYAAGLWEPRHKLQDDDSDGSVTVITHDARDEAGEVHDRMPVFLDPGQAEAWMQAGSEEAMGMLMGAELPAFEVTKVSRAINSPRHRGGPESIKPID